MDVATALRREAGQTLVEVVAAAALLLVIAVTTTTVLISSDKAAGSSSARAGASSLLASEQQRLRSLSAVGSLTDYSSTRTTSLPVGGAATPTRSYTVTSTVAPARDSGDVSCTVDASAPEYLHARTSVTWSGGGPLVGDSLISPSPGSEARALGTLAVQVVDRDKAPVAGAAVTVGNRSRTTNALGCVVLSYLPAGSYGVSASLGSEIAPDGSAPATTSATVIAGATAQANLTLDAPGELPIAFSSATRAGVAVPATIAPPTSLSVTNPDATFNGTSGANAPVPRVLTWSSARSSITGLFPFTTAYSAYAGGCTANDPGSTQATSARVNSGTNATLTVRMPTVALKVTGPSGFSVNALRTIGLTIPGCAGTATMPATARVGSTDGVTSLALPYGTYTACYASGTYKGTLSVPNTSSAGTTLLTLAVTKYTSTQTC